MHTHMVNYYGNIVFRGTEEECWMYVSNNQGNNIIQALNHDGWLIEENDDVYDIIGEVLI